MNAEAASLLRQLELDADPRTLVSQLKVGAQQVVHGAHDVAVGGVYLPLGAHAEELLQVRDDVRGGTRFDPLLGPNHLDDLRGVAEELVV